MCDYISEDFAGYVQAHRDRCVSARLEENYSVLRNVKYNFLVFNV